MKGMQEDLTKMFVGIGNNLAEIIASKAYEFWERKDFHLYVAFENISQDEQDRMFNELEVSLIGLFDLHIDAIRNEVDEPFQKVLTMVQQEIALGFVALLEKSGVEKKFLKEWNSLIDMRLKEYRKDFQKALQESEKTKELAEKKELRTMWAVVETITIDCLSHIRHGDVKEEDPLWKLLRKWLISVDGQIIAPIIQLAKEA